MFEDPKDGPQPQGEYLLEANNLMVRTKWSQWSPCSNCDTRGYRKRTGLCVVEVCSCAPLVSFLCLITFCMSRRRRKMYCGHARLYVCVSVCPCVCLSAAVRPHYCTDPDVTWGRGRGCPLVVHCWADLQSVHGLRCYGNITRILVTSLRPSRDMTT